MHGCGSVIQTLVKARSVLTIWGGQKSVDGARCMGSHIIRWGPGGPLCTWCPTWYPAFHLGPYRIVWCPAPGLGAQQYNMTPIAISGIPSLPTGCVFLRQDMFPRWHSSQDMCPPEYPGMFSSQMSNPSPQHGHICKRGRCGTGLPWIVVYRCCSIHHA